jgi:hypothetical protein
VVRWRGRVSIYMTLVWLLHSIHIKHGMKKSLDEWRKASTAYSYADEQKSRLLMYVPAKLARQESCRRSDALGASRVVGVALDMRPTKARPCRRYLMTHKYRWCIVVLSINKSVESNEEQKVLMSSFDQGFTINTSKQVFRGI